MLRMLHEGHQGVVKSIAQAKHSVYWFNIYKDIELYIKKCAVCAKHAPSQKKSPMLSHEIPELPYQNIAVDILDFKGTPYLVVFDVYSKWLDVVQMKDKKSKSVIDVLKLLFSIHGIPEIVYADNNPFISKECTDFAVDCNFKFVTCSPHYHQSNSHAERAVGMARKMLDKCASDKNITLSDCLLQYRSTPIPRLNVTPSQILMSRILKTKLPVKTCVLKPCIVNVYNQLVSSQKEMAKNYNKSATKKEVKFKVGDYVFVQNVLTKKWEPGIVLECLKEPRSYLVQVGNGHYRRNMCMIKPRYDINIVNDCTTFDFNVYELYKQVFAEPVVPIVIPEPVVNKIRKSSREKRQPNRLNL